jgi:hypothetical protein
VNSQEGSIFPNVNGQSRINFLIFQFYSLELNLIKNLLQCHIAIDFDIDCIKSIVSLKEINDIFNDRLPMLNSKQSKEVNF